MAFCLTGRFVPSAFYDPEMKSFLCVPHPVCGVGQGTCLDSVYSRAEDSGELLGKTVINKQQVNK